MNLPAEFLASMEALLKDEYADFFNSLNEEKTRGLRVNTLKVSVNDFIPLFPFALESIPWTREGFYYEGKAGSHLLHHAGLYYIQDPSAMAVAYALDPESDDRILDLCAAPGGKCTHIAAMMGNNGLIIANDIIRDRANILSQNIERLGIINTIVTSESTDNLSKRFLDYFDKILVDAPCSGEGMFRKGKEAAINWRLESIRGCSFRQIELLNKASLMLKGGGRMVYSTCTFSPLENEEVIDRFLKANRDFTVENVIIYPGFSQGRPDWVEGATSDLCKTIRIWPHKVRGEGHYIAVLKKASNDSDNIKPKIKEKDDIIIDDAIISIYKDFVKDFSTIEGRFELFKEYISILPHSAPSLRGLKVVRPGLIAGKVKNGRFEPAHSLAMSINKKAIERIIELDNNCAEKYIKGETFTFGLNYKGWIIVANKGFPLGWGKISENTLKNHYPKALRINRLNSY